jgi:hypothetical protein
LSRPRLTLLALLLLASCAATPAPPPRAAPDGPAHLAEAPAHAPAAPPPPAWERIREVDGIVVDRREVPGSPVIAFRGEGVVKAPLVRVAAVITDVSRSTEWVDSVSESRELRRISDTESISYSRIKSPPLIADRDFVMHGDLEASPGRIVIRVRSIVDDAMPPGRNVRGEVHDSSFVLTTEPDGSTRVVCEIHADPKGSIPTWVVNLFQKGWAVKTIRSLREQVKKPDIVEPAWLRALVANGT